VCSLGLFGATVQRRVSVSASRVLQDYPAVRPTNEAIHGGTRELHRSCPHLDRRAP
jgi:hypothetical protein